MSSVASSLILLMQADKKYLYKLSHWASDNEELEVTPSSKLLLFEPSTAEVAMRSGRKCCMFVILLGSHNYRFAV